MTLLYELPKKVMTEVWHMASYKLSYSTVGTLIDTGSQSVVVANTVEEYCAIILRVDTPSVPPYLTQKSASFSFVRFHFHGATTTTVQYLS